LGELKNELSAIERKIQLSIKPENATKQKEPREKQETVSIDSGGMIRTKDSSIPWSVLALFMCVRDRSDILFCSFK
jgi:hypothetical protein